MAVVAHSTALVNQSLQVDVKNIATSARVRGNLPQTPDL